jgi:hypothetical protein
VFLYQLSCIIFYYCSTLIHFVQLLFSHDSFVHSSLFVRKYSVLILDCFPGILIPLYKNHHHPCKSINIIHRTALSLSLYRSEWPITIIDIEGYTKPIFSKPSSKQRARQTQWQADMSRQDANVSRIHVGTFFFFSPR